MSTVPSLTTAYELKCDNVAEMPVPYSEIADYNFSPISVQVGCFVAVEFTNLTLRSIFGGHSKFKKALNGQR